MNISHKLTIVIPCKNEESYIERTINSIVNQKNIIGTRVIIADAFSTDRTRIIISDLQTKFKDIIQIELINGGPVSFARNKGASMVETKYTLFLDADTVLDNPNIINDSIFDMYHYKLDLLTCKVKSYGKNIKTSLMFMLFNPINYLLSLTTPFAVGMFFLTKTKIFNELGGFDETLQHSEDFWLSKQYSSKKFRISKHYIGQDDRRFKKMGYFGMIKLLIDGYLNQDCKEYFQRDVNYWD